MAVFILYVCITNSNDDVYMYSSDTDIQKLIGITSFKLKSFILKSHFILTLSYKKFFYFVVKKQEVMSERETRHHVVVPQSETHLRTQPPPGLGSQMESLLHPCCILVGPRHRLDSLGG